MPSNPSLLDFSVLLAPISSKHPTGKNLRENADLLTEYQKIKDARAAARTIERQQIKGGEKSAKADWQVVYQSAVDILSTHTKDLEIAAWLIEALLRQAGFVGLSEGFKLTRQLIEKFWDELYPLPDEEGITSRVMPLTGLNGEAVDGSLIAPIALMPLTEDKSPTTYTLWHYHQALDLLKITDPEKRAQRIAAGSVSLEMIETALKQSSVEFLQMQRQALLQCIEEYQQLIQTLEEKCGDNTPPSSRILLQLKTCLDCLNCTTQPTIMEISAPIETSTTALIQEPLNNPNNTTSREQILQTLLQAANFFRTTEPHSPLPYLLERAVRWAKTPLPLLLTELIQDENIRGQVGNLTGIGFEK